MYKLLKLTFLSILLSIRLLAFTFESPDKNTFDIDFHSTIIKHILETWTVEVFGISFDDKRLKSYRVSLTQDKSLLTINLKNSKTKWKKKFKINVHEDYLSLAVYKNLLKELYSQMLLEFHRLNRRGGGVRGEGSVSFFLLYPRLNFGKVDMNKSSKRDHFGFAIYLLNLAFVYEQSPFYSVEKLKAMAGAEYVLGQWFLKRKNTTASFMSKVNYISDFLYNSIKDVRKVVLKEKELHKYDHFNETIRLLVTGDFTKAKNWYKNLDDSFTVNFLVLHLMSKSGSKDKKLIKYFTQNDKITYFYTLAQSSMLNDNTYNYYRGQALTREVKRWYKVNNQINLMNDFKYSENNLSKLKLFEQDLLKISKHKDIWIKPDKDGSRVYYKLSKPLFSKMTLSMVYQFLLNNLLITKALDSQPKITALFQKKLSIFFKNSIFKFKFVNVSSLTKDDLSIIKQELEVNAFNYSPKFWFEAAQAFQKHPVFVESVLKYFKDNSKGRMDLSYYTLLLKQILFSNNKLKNKEGFLATLVSDVSFLEKLQPYNVEIQNLKLNLDPKSYPYKEALIKYDYHNNFRAILEYYQQQVLAIKPKKRYQGKEAEYIGLARNFMKNENYTESAKYYKKYLEIVEKSNKSAIVRAEYARVLIRQNKLYLAEEELRNLYLDDNPFIHLVYAELLEKKGNKVLQELVLLRIVKLTGEWALLEKFYDDNQLSTRKIFVHNYLSGKTKKIEKKPLNWMSTLKSIYDGVIKTLYSDSIFIQGMRVNTVNKNSLAEKGGLQREDIIIEMNKTLISGIRAFRQSASRYKIDKVPFELTVWRKGKKEYLQFGHTKPSMLLGYDYRPISFKILGDNEQIKIKSSPQNYDSLYLNFVDQNSSATQCGLREHDLLYVANNYFVNEKYALIFSDQVKKDLNFLIKRDNNWMSLDCPKHAFEKMFDNYGKANFSVSFGFDQSFLKPSWLPPFPNQSMTEIIKKLSNVKEDGKYAIFFKDKSLAKLINFKNGLKDGLFKKWHPEFKYLHQEFQYKQGKKHGIQKQWQNKSHLEWTREFYQGKEHGFTQFFYLNGETRYTAYYKNGKLDGLNKFYNRNGDLTTEYIYKNNKRISSKFIRYSSKTNNIEEIREENSNGVEVKRFDSKGGFLVFHEKMNNKKTGFEKYYRAKKILYSAQFYKNEVKVKTERYNLDGSLYLKTLYQFKSKKNYIIQYDGEGKLFSEQINGIKSGIFETWTHFEDQKLTRKSYKKGKFHGEQKEWFSNGVLKSIKYFNNGLEEGTHKYFTKENRLEGTVIYKKGKRQSAKVQGYSKEGKINFRRTIDETGKEISESYFKGTEIIKSSVIYDKKNKIEITKTFYRNGYLKSTKKVIDNKIVEEINFEKKEK
ncbi:MAG: hypothetical protein COB02_16020 [Candidatus Cloacimonadota bacterium]|nr:MAG: hypothetical protein COB02_16020 [Candidatus Cloacimonadota bacterium]